MMTCHSERIKELTERAKSSSPKSEWLEIGESCYVEILAVYIREYRLGNITSEELVKRQKELETKLSRYYQHCEVFDRAVEIRNRYSEVLTEAEKKGCPICKKLVKIFDGRDFQGEQK